MTTRARKRRAPTRDAPTRHQRAAYKPSAARVHRHSRCLQLRGIGARTLTGHVASRPIGHDLAKEKLANNIHHTGCHQNTLLFPQLTHATDAVRGHEKRAHTPQEGAHATLTNVTIAHKPTHTQPHQRRQYGETRHIKGSGRTLLTSKKGAATDALPTRGRPRRLHNSTPTVTHATRRHYQLCHTRRHPAAGTTTPPDTAITPPSVTNYLAVACRAPLRSPAPRLTRFAPTLGSHFTATRVA